MVLAGLEPATFSSIVKCYDHLATKRSGMQKKNQELTKVVLNLKNSLLKNPIVFLAALNHDGSSQICFFRVKRRATDCH